MGRGGPPDTLDDAALADTGDDFFLAFFATRRFRGIITGISGHTPISAGMWWKKRLRFNFLQ
jgi:hypothetical protein